MSAEKIENTCFICYHQHKCKASEDENNKLSDQMLVVFLLRNVLEIPKTFCETLLATKGNPSQWIYCCPTCSKTVHDLKKVYTELAMVQKKYDLLKQKVKLTLDNSRSIQSANRIEFKKIAKEQTQTGYEIRRYIFSEEADVTHGWDIIKVEADAHAPQEIEKYEDDPFFENREDSHDNFGLSGEIDDVNFKKEDKKIDETRGLRKRGKNASKTAKIIEDSDGSTSEEFESDDSDSEWESGNVAEDIGSENSEDKKMNEKEPEITAPKKKRKMRTKKSDSDKTTNGTEKIYSCSQCQESFKFVNDLVFHNTMKHGKKYTCGHCDALFETSSEGKAHYDITHPTESVKLQSYTDTKDKNCDLCGVLIVYGEKKKHMQEFHRTNKCSFCEKIYKERTNLKRHCRAAHFKELNLEHYQCNVCKKRFKGREGLRGHMASQHTKKFRFYCDLCGHGCLTKTYLDDHILRYHSNGTEDKNCDICGVLVLCAERRKHIQEFHSTYNCLFCEKICSKLTYLKRHCRAAHFKELNLEPYQCDLCKKRFKCPSGLRSHMVSQHTKKYRLFCDLCDYGCLTKTNLNNHILRMHSNHSKEFSCKFCDNKFFTARNAEEHEIRTHTKEYKFNCELCGKGFLFKKHLERHVSTYHSGSPKEFPCELCTASFDTQSLLKIHQRGRHYKELNLEPYQCTECGLTFALGDSIKKHMITKHTKAYNLFCNECGKPFITPGELNRHIRHIHKREVECLCNECGKPFFNRRSLLSHIRHRHTNVKKDYPYKCTICPDRGYSHRRTLNRHMKMIHPQLLSS